MTKVIIKTIIYITLYFAILYVLWPYLVGEPFMESMKSLF